MSNKRGYIILFFILCLVILPIINAEITGRASSQETGISVYVLPGVPSLSIISPAEGSNFLTTDFILLDYSATLIDTVWYNLDNTNNITINSSLYFQTSAGSHTLYLYGNQSNGTILSDNVTFTVSSPPTGGGGGRARIEEIGIFLEKDTINVVLKQGETKEVGLLVKNNHNKKVKVNFEDLNLEDLLIDISETEFYLNPGETKEIRATFTAFQEKIPNLYIEKAVISTSDTAKEIIFYVEVESKEPLFDVKVDIPKDPSIYKPGEELIANVDFFNLGGIGETEIQVEYLIQDTNKKILFGEKQTLIIGTSMSLIKSFRIPEDTKDGDYIFYVKAVYDSKTASASKSFKIMKESAFQKALKKLGEEFEKNKKEILTAFVIACAIYFILGVIEYLFGPKGKYYLFKKRRYYAGKRERNGLRRYKRRVRRKINRKK